jgi:hypothetical protein
MTFGDRLGRKNVAAGHGWKKSLGFSLQVSELRRATALKPEA